MPGPTRNNHNAFSILEDKDVDDDEITVVRSNVAPKKNGAYKATSTIDIPIDVGIVDTGATGNFLQPGAPAVNIRITKTPICISQPDGGKLTSTHECDIDNPILPPAARAAHIVPGLAHTSLVSIRMLIDGG